MGEARGEVGEKNGGRMGGGSAGTESGRHVDEWSKRQVSSVGSKVRVL